MFIQKLKSNLNIKNLIKSFVVLISLTLLLYQTICLFSIYFKYQTSVDIEIKRSEINKFPAISVCFANFYIISDAENIMRKNSTFNSIINEYIKQNMSKYELIKKSSKEFDEIYQKYYSNYTQLSSFYYVLPQIWCKLKFGYQRTNESYNCEDINRLIRSRTRSFECLTFFSEMQINNESQSSKLDVALKEGIWSENKVHLNQDLKQFVDIVIGEEIYTRTSLETKICMYFIDMLEN